jgi:hypothetical protein
MISLANIMMEDREIIRNLKLQSNLYQKVIFGTKKKWSFKTDDLLKEVQFI